MFSSPLSPNTLQTSIHKISLRFIFIQSINYWCESNLLLPCWPPPLAICMELPSSFFVGSVLDFLGMHFARTTSPSCSTISNREPLQGTKATDKTTLFIKPFVTVMIIKEAFNHGIYQHVVTSLENFNRF